MNRLGYRHPGYAQSLSMHGQPLALPDCGGWVLERPLPDGTGRDAMGPYPIFSCRDWHALERDVDSLARRDLLTLTLVTDPVADIPGLELDRCFDIVRPFKTHFFAELDRPSEQIPSRHHAYYARRAARALRVERAADPSRYLAEWHTLYAALATRHSLDSVRSFSYASFAALLALPDVVMYLARCGERCVGAQLMLIEDDVAHAHLAAFNEEGYALGASYLLDRHVLDDLRGEVSRINWGGGRAAPNGDDGLVRYKRGWATGEKTSWLLGRIFDHDAYHAAAPADTHYFPAYRHGEFS